MKIQLKMLGDLRQYLPVAGQFNQCELCLAEGSVVSSLLAQLPLPAEKSYLLMVNGDMLHEPDFASTRLQAGDEVVLFPPIKGG